ncbi:hypothetical protein [Rhodopirellula bahusiensis]|uniref:hypothetical protein n=1 Tax=Rhodopirellula bahusiensis TaxID=2014065 RepID=UPI0032635DC5
MPLHSKDDIREMLDDEVYASSDLSKALPKFKFPSEEQSSQHIYAAVRDELMLDGNSRQNLAAFCAPDLVWDFRLPRVKSINASGHKSHVSITTSCDWAGKVIAVRMPLAMKRQTTSPEKSKSWVHSR